ncbi:MAG: dihydroorotate dehydrogenase electron transfer subunit [Muribaculaceae bacterium]|nr:dihydroorotate dehydrogenase electron transfer subunit [Muribaculaceae bacterium]
MYKKETTDFKVVECVQLNAIYSLLKLSPAGGSPLPPVAPGQFVQVKVPGCEDVFLRRPISINFVDTDSNSLWLLVRRAGKATEVLCDIAAGEIVNLILPLGNGFSMPAGKDASILLVGGGVGVAPLLYFGKILKDNGYSPKFLLGARSERDLLELNLFEQYGPVFTSTEDGSHGEKGLVTQHSVLATGIEHIYCCGPAPMMKAVASVAKAIGAECEVSLENMMACGVGACLCCVEKTVKGNVCVCTEGPVFNINKLTW